MAELPTYPEATSERVTQLRDDIVTRLRSTADRMEKLSVGSKLANSHAFFASQVIGDLHSMLPNMPLSNLINAATEADVARRQG